MKRKIAGAPSSLFFFRLLHLADSALPVGSFAFSNGLESAIQTGLIRSGEGFKEYLEAVLRQFQNFEGVFASRCFELKEPVLGHSLLTLLLECDAMIFLPPARRASLLQGKNWFRILEGIFPEANLAVISKWFLKNKGPTHAAIVLPLCFKRLGISQEQAKSLLLYQVLRDQISAAIRLNVIGPLEGHRLQAEIQENRDKESPESGFFQGRGPFKSAYLLEIAQANHERLYSKLFQN